MNFSIVVDPSLAEHVTMGRIVPIFIILADYQAASAAASVT